MLSSSRDIMEGCSGTLCSSTATEVSQTCSALGWCRDWKNRISDVLVAYFDSLWLQPFISHGALFRSSKGWLIGFSWQVTFLTLPINPEEKKRATDLLWEETPKWSKAGFPLPALLAVTVCDAYVATLFMHHKRAHYQVFHSSGSSVWVTEVLDTHKYGADAQYNQI